MTHVKTINGKKYYYESIRVGKKVTSRYVGPVEERVRKKKQPQREEEQKEKKEEEIYPEESDYIG